MRCFSRQIIYEANKENYPDYKVKTTYHDKYGTTLYETDYTNAIFDNGTKFRLPVEAVNIEDDATGFWGRIFDRIYSHGYEY